MAKKNIARAGLSARVELRLGRAIEMLVTGDTIDAAEAYRMGLVNYIMPADELLGFSRAWLRKVLANGPRAFAKR